MENKEYNPYDLIFQTMPFNVALNWSIRYATENVNKAINAKYSIYKWLNDFEETGMIVFDSRQITPSDFEIAMGMALKAQSK